MRKKITLIDYGVGNILSLQRALEFLSLNVEITSEPKKIEQSSYLILPGDGAFGFALNNLKKKKIFDLILNHVLNSKPLFGICIGMQLLMSESNEFGKFKGLDIIKGKIIRIKKTIKNKVPAIGWSEILVNKKYQSINSIQFEKFNKKEFYFIHSYKAVPENEKHIIGHYFHGEEKIPAIIGKENIIGTQFHPEKSGKNGLDMIKKFTKL